MAALANSRNTPERAGQVIEAVPVAASAICYVGALVAVDASGNLNPAADTAGLKVLGRCEGKPGPGITGLDADNTGGIAGAVTANVKRGCFKFDNSSGDPLAAADIGNICYAEDDHTVNKAGGTNKVVAGLFLGLDADGGAWIDTLTRRRVTYTLTSSQNATAAATDLTTSEALANALKANYNQLQADVVALRAQLS
jgi:hypothetical protein